MSDIGQLRSEVNKSSRKYWRKNKKSLVSAKTFFSAAKIRAEFHVRKSALFVTFALKNEIPQR